MLPNPGGVDWWFLIHHQSDNKLILHLNINDQGCLGAMDTLVDIRGPALYRGAFIKLAHPAMKMATLAGAPVFLATPLLTIKTIFLLSIKPLRAKLTKCDKKQTLAFFNVTQQCWLFHHKQMGAWMGLWDAINMV